MFADKGFVSHLGRAAVLAGVAATVLTSMGPTAAVAAPVAKEKGLTAAGTSGATGFTPRRRSYPGGGAAGAPAFAGIVGLGIASIAAANARRDYYYAPPGYYGYGGPPVAYYPADSYYYGGGYYGGGRPYYGGYDTGMRPYYYNGW